MELPKEIKNEKENYIITGQIPQKEFIKGMFKEGGINAIMNTDDEFTKADSSL
jgi:hypothetical protein